METLPSSELDGCHIFKSLKLRHQRSEFYNNCPINGRKIKFENFNTFMMTKNGDYLNSNRCRDDCFTVVMRIVTVVATAAFTNLLLIME